MQARNSKNKPVRFIRKNGRIIPIEVDVDVATHNRIGGASANSMGSGSYGRERSNGITYAGLGAGALGAGVAADAARTRRVYEKHGITIDRKRFAIQPFVYDRLGDKLIMRDKLGKKMGTAAWYKQVVDNEKVGSFSWLGIKKKYRGQGHSATLSRVAAHQMKKEGMTGVWNQVVHQGSLRTNYTRNDSLWKAKGNTGSLRKITMKEAERNINWYRNVKGLYTSDIYRLTKLKKQKTVMPGIRKAYMTGGTKAKLATGLAAAAVGSMAALYNER